MPVDPDVTPQFIAESLQDVSARPALASAINSAFEDATFTFHIPALRAGTLETEQGNQIAGTGLEPVAESTSNDPDDMLAKLNEVIRVVNKARPGA